MYSLTFRTVTSLTPEDLTLVASTVSVVDLVASPCSVWFQFRRTSLSSALDQSASHSYSVHPITISLLFSASNHRDSKVESII